MGKLDLAKSDPEYYKPPARPTEIVLPPLRYVAIDGRGEPGGAVHSEATEAQFTVAYVLKFACKARDLDFVVAKQEGLWWFGDGESRPAAEVPRSKWNWTLLIRLPEFVNADAFDEAKATAAKKKPGLAAIDRVQLRELHEGRSVQMMHLGPFSTEPETVAIMQEYLNEHDLEFAGAHHEIYLTDFRKLPEDRWKTVLRYPVRPR